MPVPRQPASRPASPAAPRARLTILRLWAALHAPFACLAPFALVVSIACGGGDAPTAGSTTPGARDGMLSVTIAGLPDAASATVTVTPDDGVARTLSAPALLSLPAGNIRVEAGDVTRGEDRYAPAVAAQSAVVRPGATVSVAVSYAIATGSIMLRPSGLPDGGRPAIVVTGPSNFSRRVSAPDTLRGLAPGTYALVADTYVHGGATWLPAASRLDVTVVAGPSPVPASIPFTLASGSIVITADGLPEAVVGTATISGPEGFSRPIATGDTVANLLAGNYMITAVPVRVGDDAYAPPSPVQVVVTPSAAAIAAPLRYRIVTGRLAVTLSGVPAGATPVVAVSGPAGFARTLAASGTIAGLAPGDYTLAASGIATPSATYPPSVTSQRVSVTAGGTSGVTVAWGPATPPAPSGANLTIDALHVQQVVQNYSGTVPLVAGRDGLLRVFVKASTPNVVAPPVRVRLYAGGTLASTVTLSPPSGAVPTAIVEGALGASWNYVIPAALMQPGLRVLADVDPSNTVAESSDADNAYPVSGTPAPLDVRSVAPFSVRLVPVLQGANSLQGGVTSANAAQFLAHTRAVYPLGTVDADVRAPFTTNAPALQSGDGNGAWGQVLSEINALRAADGSARYYYGVVKVAYSSGVAGLGYVPGRAAIGWDYLPSAAEVMAHEIGHNFGRFHSPCGGAGGSDPAYPHAGGTIGVFGYDASAGSLRPPATSDLMGYCGNPWISDYNYTAVLNYRAAQPFSASAAFAGGYARTGLLVWGRVEGGRVILEPAFEVDAPPSLPGRPGRHRIEGFNSLGGRVLDFSFDGERPADHPDAASTHFAFVVPLAAFGGALPARLRLTAGGRQAEQALLAPSTETPTVSRSARGRVEISWRDSATRGVLVRDARTGDILSFARGGRATVHTTSGELDLTISGGVGSVQRRVRLRD